MGILFEKMRIKSAIPMFVAGVAILLAAGSVSHAEEADSSISVVSGVVLESVVSGAVLEDGFSVDTDLEELIEAEQGYQVEAVEPIDISECGTLTVSKDKYTYAGIFYEPPVSLTYTDPETGKATVLSKDTDYQLSYAENMNVGTAIVTVTGIGDYTGTITGGFEIVQNSLDNCSVKIEYTEVMGDGSKKTPKITVFYNGAPLTKNVDYTLSYSNNVNAGVAEVVVKGINNWEGSVTKNFKIKYSAVKDLAYIPTSGVISLTWDKMIGIAGYEVFRSTSADGDFTKLGTVTINSYVDKDVSYDNTYFYKIRAFGTMEGQVEYGAYTSPLKVSAGEQIAAAITPYQGVRYVTGGASPKGWDCSGFTQWIMKNKFGVDIPRTSREQAKVGTKVNMKNQAEWLPGDLIFFSKNGRVCHVAVYIGDGMMMHASSTYKKTIVVNVDDYNRRCIANDMSGVRRVL